MRFGQFLIMESQGQIKSVVDDVINQFAEEQRWNAQEILQVVYDRLMEIPEFRDDPQYLKSAMATAEHYVTK